MSDNFQFYNRTYQYIEEYQSLLHDYYSKHGIAFIVTYYNLNVNSTVWDNDEIYGGSYEKIGDLSGMKWDKYLLLPIYWVDEISTVFDAEERGYIKQNDTSIVIPSTYNITPYPNDMIKLDQHYLRPNNDKYPLYIVSGIEIYPNEDRRYWKLKIETFQSKNTDELDDQVENTYSFFEYTKKIYTVPQASFLNKMMIKSEQNKNNLDNLFNENSGVYFL